MRADTRHRGHHHTRSSISTTRWKWHQVQNDEEKWYPNETCQDHLLKDRAEQMLKIFIPSSSHENKNKNERELPALKPS